MSFFADLLENKDILDHVVFEWLDAKDLINLDKAVIPPSTRNEFLNSLAGVRYSVPFERELDKWWKHHKDIISWVVSREMYNCEGVWHVNQKLWEHLTSDEKYENLLSSMRGIRFENFSGKCSLPLMSKCSNLSRLEVCNLLDVHDNPTPLSIPTLTSAYFQNVNFDKNFLQLFSALPNLKSIHLQHCKFGEVSVEAAAHFMANIEHVHVIGNMDEFLAKFIRKECKLQSVTLDKLHKAESVPQDLSQFLQFVPDLRTLSVDRLRLHIPSFFKCLSSYNKHLNTLHLNHIRLVDQPSNCPDVPVTLTLSSLQISTLLCSDQQELLSVLDHCKGTLNTLILSFCRLDRNAYLKISESMTALRTIEIHDKEANIMSSSEDVANKDSLVEIFRSVPNVKIVHWPEWKAEKEKMLYPTQKTIVYDKTF